MKIIVNRFENIKGLENVLWYGGVVASIECEDKSKYVIAARGDVKCKLVAKRDFLLEKKLEEDEYEEIEDYKLCYYKKGDVISEVSDKGENGRFYTEMNEYIKDDEHLVSILTNSDENMELVFGNNNWLELSYYDANEDMEYDVVLDDDDITEAINSVMKEVRANENFERKSHSIYCRTALYSEDAIKKQISSNMYELQLKHPEISGNDVNIYIDNGFSGVKLNNPSLLYLLEDLKTNDMKDVYTTSVNRISRNIINIVQVQNLLKDLKTDIYCSKEIIYLKDAFSNKEKEVEMDYEK